MSNILPLIPLRGTILFPNNNGQFDIGREKSIEAIKYASEKEGTVIFAVQKDESEQNSDTAQMHTVATMAKILSVNMLPNHALRVLVDGLKRVRLLTRYDFEPDKFLSAYFEEITSEAPDRVSADAYRKSLFEILDELSLVNKNLPSEILAVLKREKDDDTLINRAATLVTVKDNYPILEETDVIKRYEVLIEKLIYELEVLRAEKRINVRVKHSLDKSQKEYILREQMKVLSEELDDQGEKDIGKKISELNAADDIKKKLLKELEKLKKVPMTSPEYSIITGYAEFAAELPWGKLSEEISDISHAKKILDREHYGLKKVKERILEYIAVHNLTGKFKSPVLCFIGPPGVGKTSVAKSIAEATGRRFVRMSLGGVSDESEIRGHRKTYVAAMPGRILNGIKQAGVDNPVFLLDEIDKLARSNHGDPSSALLEVLDPEQNVLFRDNYLEVPYDLSQVMFLTTANDRDSIPEPLLDRMEIIEMPSYSPYEKLNIAKNHLIKKQAELCGLFEENVKVDDKAIESVILKYTREAGVRELERAIAKIMRKCAVRYAESGSGSEVTEDSLAELLGKKTIIRREKRQSDEIGTATGLAWTSSGGDILPIEISTVKGRGDVVMTGNLKDIIKESVKVALSYVHSVADKHGISEAAFENLDFHVHLPENAVPKDGPSAGIGFASAIYSVLTRRPIKTGVAMTGELTLRGKVTAVGGIKEKIMAGQRAGITKFFIPSDNIIDTEEIPAEILDKIEVFPVTEFDDLLIGGLVFGDADKKKIKTSLKREERLPDNVKTVDEIMPKVLPLELPGSIF